MRALVRARRIQVLVFVAMFAAMAIAAGNAAAMGRRHHGDRGGSPGVFTNQVLATGDGIMHAIPGGSSEQISKPDDITRLGNHIFVAFQNGVGPQGQPSTSNNVDSTIVEFDLSGRAVKQWDITGKCDGLTADPAVGGVIATVNEDLNSSLYVIDPHGGTTHFSYSSDPLPHNGGTDAITIYHGMVLISASAPGTIGAAAPDPSYPAVYVAMFDFGDDVVTLMPMFTDGAQTTLANVGPQFGTPQALALTDPDSSARVPGYAARFGGDFMLTSQGDQEQIFVRHAAKADQSLSVLQLSSSVDDTAWATGPNGALLTTDNSNNTIDKITGPFTHGAPYVADTPCDENTPPNPCPANSLGQLDPFTGQISQVTVNGPAVEPQGLLFLPGSRLKGHSNGQGSDAQGSNSQGSDRHGSHGHGSHGQD